MIEKANKVLEHFNHDRSRLLDILIEIQKENGYISQEIKSEISSSLKISKVDIDQVISFFHFISDEPTGKYSIYLNDSVVSNMMGRKEVLETFEKEVGIKFGETTYDGLIGLHDTADIGMNDQEPAAIINGKVFTNLNKEKALKILDHIKEGKAVNNFSKEYGDGANSDPLVQAMVKNNIKNSGQVLLKDHKYGEALKKAVGMGANSVINEVKESNIRGRGGGGFPAGLKWEFCKKTPGEEKYLVCNADEGEPGTFKDRVLLTEYPRLLFEGMAIAAFSFGAKYGILYLRSEYTYLKNYLYDIIDQMKKENLLGENILGKIGFDFDIRIQSGAGAYVCGEVSGLLESSEGKRGEPRNKPPNTVKKGYLAKPTVANNVETLASIPEIILNGGEWYSDMGTNETTGTKLLSISGDVKFPGVYEIEWGTKVRDVLRMAGAENVQAVQVGGPSGECIGPDHFGRKICYEDLSTGGAFIVFNMDRDLLGDIVLNYMNFFIDESCGSCVPCRVLTTTMRNKLEKILRGDGVMRDIDDLQEWGRIMKVNRCGLGQTAPNPILTTIRNFIGLYREKILLNKEYANSFNLETAIREQRELAQRKRKF